MRRDSHILNAASNMLGIALLIVTGIHITNQAQKSLADEAGLGAALLLALSCMFSYLSLRSPDEAGWFEDAADKVFICGMLGLVAAVAILALA